MPAFHAQRQGLLPSQFGLNYHPSITPLRLPEGPSPASPPACPLRSILLPKRRGPEGHPEVPQIGHHSLNV